MHVKINYQSPLIQTFELSVEKGFATSDGFNFNNYGDTGMAGPDPEEPFYFGEF